jgi:ABC-type nitrate/sulfonate/bicarbonate transport system substrate-binding protein
VTGKDSNSMQRPLRIGPACYHALHLTVLMAAHEMNFFYDEGLQDQAGRENYEIIPHGLAPFGFEKTTLAQAMKDKEVHIATDVQPRTAIYLSSHGEDCCVIAGWRNNRGRTLVATREVKTLQDLREKRIGISDIGDNHHLLLTYWLRQAGLDPESDVHWITGIGPESRLTSLIEGRIDAGLVTHGQDHGAELENAGLAVIQDFSSAYPQGRPDRVIVSSNRVLEERRADVKAFLRAIVRTYWFVRDVRNFFTSRIWSDVYGAKAPTISSRFGRFMLNLSSGWKSIKLTPLMDSRPDSRNTPKKWSRWATSRILVWRRFFDRT